MQKYSEITFDFFIVFDCYPNFGIGGFMAGTTPVALIKQTLTSNKVESSKTCKNTFERLDPQIKT